MKYKKGISSVLSNVLLILIAVVAVITIGIIINNLTKNLSDTVMNQKITTDCAVQYPNGGSAYDDCVNGVSLQKYVGENACNAFRQLSGTYNPSQVMNVKINVTFNISDCGGVIVEKVPAGWNVSGITGPGPGLLDVSGRYIRWVPVPGPFPGCGGQSNVLLSYNITPNSSQTGIKFFSGEFSVDGKGCPYPDNYTIQLGGGGQCNIYTNYSEWLVCKFSAPERVNPSISGEDADPDNDGILNFLEYAFGMDPKNASTQGKPSANWLNGDLEMTYSRIRGLKDVIYTPEVARCISPLCPWNFGPLFVQPVYEIDSGDLKKIVVVRDAESWNYDNPGYMRMNITKNSSINPKSYIVNAQMLNYPICGNAVLDNGEICEVGLGDLDCKKYNHYVKLTNGLKDGLVAYYTFENSFNDSSGLGNDGVSHNGAGFDNYSYYPNGNFVANFDGVDDYVQIPPSKSLEGENMTFSFWVRMNGYNIPDFNMRSILSKGDPNINNLADWPKYDYMLLFGREKLGGGNLNNPTYDGVIKTYTITGITDSSDDHLDGSQVSTNFATESAGWYDWRMLTVIRTHKDSSIYIDGVLSKTNNFSIFGINDYHNSNSSLFIGSYPYGKGTYETWNPKSNNYFQGNLDNLMIYNRTLDSGQVHQLYDLQKKNFEEYYYNGSLSCYNCTLNFDSCDVVNYECYYYSFYNESVCTDQPGCHYNPVENGCAQGNGATCDQLGANSWYDQETCAGFGCGYNGTTCSGSNVINCAGLSTDKCQMASWVNNACYWPGQCYDS